MTADWCRSRLRWGSILLLVVAHLGCGREGTPGASEMSAVESSRFHVLLPSPYLSGYAADLKGEVLQYHSPVPMIGTSLLVRSEERSRSIAWESGVIPADFQGDAVTFALMIGIDVNVEPRRFDLRIGGRDVFQLRNPLEAELGDTLVWEGEGGVRGEFHVTLIDRYGDAMGFLFLTVPREFLELGAPLEFEVLGESEGARSWFMVFRDTLEPRMELQNAPAVLRTPDGEAQILRLDLLSLYPDQPFRLNSPIGTVDTVAPLGHTRLILPVPAVTAPEPVEVRYQLGNAEGQFTYSVVPPRRMEVFLLHHTHLDIGYTHHQDEVQRIQWASLEEALRLGEASEDNPEGARFIWNPEGLWPVETYVATHTSEETARLLEGIRRGWIQLDGMYAGLLTGLANEEVLLHTFDAARALGEASGVPIESAMLSDIPGFSWGLVEALDRTGIRYLSIGPNFGHRIGHFTEALGDRPFWWEGPSGESRVLTWVSGGGYSWFHTGLGYDSITAQLDEERVFSYLDQLFSGDYPYDMTYLRYNIGSDNGPPDPGLADAVRSWNERYASPILKISGTTATFREFEARYGDDLPTLRGDLTGHWEDGAASSARETAMVRRVAEALPQTERLAELRGVALDQKTLDQAWREVLLFYEHTWGSWNSISEPYSELTVSSWERKRAFAEEASTLAGELREAALGETEGDDPPLPGRGGLVEVINTLPWSRTELVVLPADGSGRGDLVKDMAGRIVPSQRLRSGELAFLAEDVPGESAVRFTVESGRANEGTDDDRPPEKGFTDSGIRDQGSGISTSEFAVQLDHETGDVLSILHRATGKELVEASAGGLNQYLYVPGRDPSEAVSSGPADFAWTEEGPLVWTLTSTAPAAGLRAPMTREVSLVEGWDRVHLTNRIAKEWVLDPEAILFRFPFALEDPQLRIDVPFGSFRPEADQLPGASRNYFSLQRWVDFSEEDWGVTVASIDAPLIQLGEIRTDAIVTGWLEEAENSPTLLSYVMNNYWETNYRAAQDDEVAFRYALRVHGTFREEEAERFGLEEARPLLVRVIRR
jgi:alpha-mannosidase